MTLARRWAPYAAIVLALLIVSWRIIRFKMIPDHIEIAASSRLNILETYHYTTLLANYFTEGFIRRGVPGSIFYFIRSLGYEHSLILFHGLAAVWLGAPLLILLRRLAQIQGRTWIWLTLVLVLSPQLFMAWARDVARSDMLSAGFIAWALLACLGRRYLLAALVLFVGSQTHETALAFGGSLCAAVAFLDWRAGAVKPGRLFAALGLLGALWIVATAAQQFIGPSPQAVARDMVAHARDLSHPTYWAIYNTVGGFRALGTSACLAFGSSSVYVYVAGAVVVLALYGFILPACSRLRLGLLLFACYLPMVVLSVLAIDYGRWLSFAVLNWWLINAALHLRGVDPLAIKHWPPRISIAAALAVLMMGPGGYLSANLATQKIAGRLSKHDAPAADRIDMCDPTWRSVVPTKAAPQP